MFDFKLVLNEYERTVIETELFLNVTGKTLFLQQVTCWIRCSIGISQVLFFSCVGALCALQELVCCSREPLSQRSSVACFTQTLHGVLNLGRAFVELIPVISTLFLSIWDKKGYRCSYPLEKRTTFHNEAFFQRAVNQQVKNFTAKN